MKKISSILAFAIALNMCTALTACQSSSESDSKDDISVAAELSSAVGENTTVSEKSDESPQDSSKESAADTTESVEPVAETYPPEKYVYSPVTPETDEKYSEKYGYYDTLAKEFEKYGSTSDEAILNFSFYEDFSPCGVPYYYKGKLYFIDNTQSELLTLVSYDMKTGKIFKTHLKTNGHRYSVGMCYNGKILINDEEFNYSVLDIDNRQIDGFGPLTLNNSNENNNLLYSGQILDIDTYNGSKLYSKGGKSTSISLPVIKINGLTDENPEFHLIGSYNNKAYFYVSAYVYQDDVPSLTSEYFYCLDLKEKKWKKLDISISDYSDDDTRVVGKYLIIGNSSKSYIFDMETGKQFGGPIVTRGEYNYYGGDCHLRASRYNSTNNGNDTEEETPIKMKLPNNSSPIDKNTKEIFETYTREFVYDEESYYKSFDVVTSDYYITYDSNGVYLSTFKEGESGKKQIYSF